MQEPNVWSTCQLYDADPNPFILSRDHPSETFREGDYSASFNTIGVKIYYCSLGTKNGIDTLQFAFCH